MARLTFRGGTWPRLEPPESVTPRRAPLQVPGVPQRGSRTNAPPPSSRTINVCRPRATAIMRVAPHLQQVSALRLGDTCPRRIPRLSRSPHRGPLACCSSGRGSLGCRRVAGTQESGCDRVDRTVSSRKKLQMPLPAYYKSQAASISSNRGHDSPSPWRMCVCADAGSWRSPGMVLAGSQLNHRGMTMRSKKRILVTAFGATVALTLQTPVSAFIVSSRKAAVATAVAHHNPPSYLADAFSDAGRRVLGADRWNGWRARARRLGRGRPRQRAGAAGAGRLDAGRPRSGLPRRRNGRPGPQRLDRPGKR